MKRKACPDDLVPLVRYSVRKAKTDSHGRDYKLLYAALRDGKLLKVRVGKDIYVSKSAADRFLASKVAACTAKSEPGSRLGVSMDDRVRALERTVTDLCVQLGYIGPD